MNSEVLSFGSSLLDVEILAHSTNQGASIAVPQLIASRAIEDPDGLAVASEGESLSYAELNAESNAVARLLQGAGLQVGHPVGVYFETSIEFIVAALGVWKAGGAYLPIDPAYPVDRAEFILSDSGAPLLLTRRALASALPAGMWKTICLEDVVAADLAEASGNPDALTVTPDDLAYVIYTSGSTGQPKGVEITHANLLNLVEWHTKEFSIGPSDRATQIAGPGFDAAVWELWPYLASGASVHLPSRDLRLSATHLRDWLIAQRITVSFVPTVLAEQLLKLSWPANAQLRLLLTGGDALHTFPAAGLPFVLVNNYGPTECTVVATSGTVTGDRGDKAAPAIGRPILNTAIYLLDEQGQPVAEGEAGEIYIGGPSVGRGYRNRPDLTAASFVPINVGGRTERTFRTGDLARRLPDGQLAFVGRADEQVKIRGFRIEPEEIAFVINRHPAVLTSAVIARADHGEKRLVAYVAAVAGADLWDRDLRELLSKSLPDYMVPSNFVLLDKIPVTANGKLDKAALPAPTEANQLRRDSYVSPRNEVEEIVEGILGPILALDRVSIHDNFFLLGGHSLMGAQVIAKVRDVFDVELNLRNVFECPTVAKLAAKIEATLTARLEAMSEEEVHRALRAQSASTIMPCGSGVKAS